MRVTLDRWDGGRSSGVIAVALAIVALLLVVRTIDSLGDNVLDDGIWRSSDTRGLVMGADVAIACAKEGTWRGCALLPPGALLVEYPDVRGSGVDRFPPLLYAPAVMVQAAGGGRGISLRIIGMLSLMSFVGLIALPWLVGPSTQGLHRNRHLWSMVIIASPLLPYAGSTWSEVHAAALMAAAVALVAAEAPPWLVGLVALGAGLSKDTAPVFVAALALAVAQRRPNGRRWLPISPALGAALVGSLAASALTVAFNVFRYDSLTNITYLAPTFQVRAPTAVAGQAVALLVSANGGLLPFWPATALLVVLAALAFRRGSSEIRLRLAVVAAACSGFILSLALWWSPFGWWSWSPRLSIPLIPAVGAAILVLTPADFRPGRPLLLAAVAAVVLAVPQSGITGNSSAITPFMKAPRPACQPGAKAEPAFVRCTLDRAWRQQPSLLLEGARGLRQPFAALLSAATAAGGIGLVVCWRRETGSRRHPRHGGRRLAGDDSTAKPAQGVMVDPH